MSESKTILEINNILIINHFIDSPKNSRLLPLSINILPKHLTYVLVATDAVIVVSLLVKLLGEN